MTTKNGYEIDVISLRKVQV